MRRSTRRCETSVWGSRLAISSSSWRSAPTGIMCISWCNRADLQRHQAGDDDQEPDSARDLSALSSGEEAVVGRGVLDGWLFCQHGWATRQRGHDQRLRQEARPGLPEATRKPPVGSLLKYPAACGGDPLFMRNVLLISIDDLFTVRIFEKAFGISIHTPNLDRLSEQGLYFENAFCTTALCTPSRTAVLSGRNPFDTGVQTNSQDWQLYVDPMETLPSHFKQAGYNTSSFGKTYPSTPSFLDGSVLDSQHNQTRELAVRDEVTDDYVNVHKALDYLSKIKNQDSPYFMMVGLHDPHGPQTSPPQYYDLYPLDQIVVPKWEGDEPPEYVKQFLNTEEVQRMLETGTMEEFIQSYLANISEMDARLGELLDGVKASGTDPIITLYSDHGYSLGDHDHVHTFTLWEQTTQVPLVIYDSRSPASHGVEYEDVVSLIDIGPTLLDMAGLHVPDNWDGSSLAET